jgi:hypothetical protein
MALDKSTLKKIGCFFASFACIIGAIGGFGTCAYHHEWPIAICIVVVSACAVPTVVKMVKYLLS